MSSHVFHEIYLHINWHAKNNHPLLTARLEPLVHDFVRQRCRQTKGVYLHGVNGTATHLRQLPWVLDYIAKQKEHHAAGTIKRRLEQIGFDDDGRPAASV